MFEAAWLDALGGEAQSRRKAGDEGLGEFVVRGRAQSARRLREGAGASRAVCRGAGAVRAAAQDGEEKPQERGGDERDEKRVATVVRGVRFVAESVRRQRQVFRRVDGAVVERARA